MTDRPTPQFVQSEKLCLNFKVYSARLRWFKGLSFSIFGCFLAGCIVLPPEYNYNVSPGTPKYGYQPAETEKAPPRSSIGTLAIVRPALTSTSAILGSAVEAPFASSDVPAQVMLGGRSAVRDTTSDTRKLVRQYLLQFQDSAKVDLERIFHLKGINTMGPFNGVGEMTFSQKKEATFGLVPEIHVDVQESSGQVTVSGWFALVLTEPLSGQKIWTKKLEQEGRSAKATHETERSIRFYVIALGDTFSVTDDRAKVAAELLSQFYRDIMDRIWKHTDPEEFATLLGQAKELKARAAPVMR